MFNLDFFRSAVSQTILTEKNYCVDVNLCFLFITEYRNLTVIFSEFTESSLQCVCCGVKVGTKFFGLEGGRIEIQFGFRNCCAIFND